MMKHRARNGVDTFQVEIDSSTQYATVYCCYTTKWPIEEKHEKPIATLIRKRVIEQGPHWRLYNLAGQEIGDGFSFAISALKYLAREQGE